MSVNPTLYYTRSPEIWTIMSINKWTRKWHGILQVEHWMMVGDLLDFEATELGYLDRTWRWPYNYDLSILGLMHEIWTMSTANMTYNKSQNYTNIMIGKHRLQTFEVVVVVLLLLLLTFHVFSLQMHIPYYFLDQWSIQIYLDVNSFTFNLFLR